MKNIFRTVAYMLVAIGLVTAVPTLPLAWAASCPAGATCITFATFWSTFTYLVTGGTTARSDLSRWTDNGMSVVDAGIDCTGATDSTVAFQAAVNAMPDGGNLWFPIACQMKLSSTITIRSRANIGFRSAATGSVGSCEGSFPKITWTASGGTVFDFEYVDTPLIKGLNFVNGSGAYIDTVLNFDRTGTNTHGKTGTAGRILSSCFSNGSNQTVDFTAIYIAPTTNSNEENFIVNDIFVGCSNSQNALRSVIGSISSSSTTLTSADAAFVSGDVGAPIWITYPGFFLKTTISSVTNGTTVVLAVTPSITQSNVQINTGQGYGYAIHVGNSQNSIQHQFSNIGYFKCDKGIFMEGGSAEIHHLNGGLSDYGAYISSAIQNVLVDFYEAEYDMRGIEVINGGNAPVMITNTRAQNGSQLADGFIKVSGLVTLMSTFTYVSPPTNAVLIGANGTPSLTSIGNNFNALTWAQIGYSIFGLYPVTTINDHFDTTGGIGPHNFGCFSNNAGNQPAGCVTINGNFGHEAGTGLQLNSVNYYGDATYSETDVKATTAPIQNSKTYSAAGTALPACVTALKGSHAVVSDATSPTYLGSYSSGGAVIAPVFCNGSAWLTD